MPTATAQAEQQRLLQEAAKRPGVREAINVYSRIEPHLEAMPTIEQRPQASFATGGNR